VGPAAHCVHDPIWAEPLPGIRRFGRGRRHRGGVGQGEEARARTVSCIATGDRDLPEIALERVLEREAIGQAADEHDRLGLMGIVSASQARA